MSTETHTMVIQHSLLSAIPVTPSYCSGCYLLRVGWIGKGGGAEEKERGGGGRVGLAINIIISAYFKM